jgi:hypothetical protein
MTCGSAHIAAAGLWEERGERKTGVFGRDFERFYHIAFRHEFWAETA